MQVEKTSGSNTSQILPKSRVQIAREKLQREQAEVKAELLFAKTRQPEQINTPKMRKRYPKIVYNRIPQPLGLCSCGCGMPTAIAKKTDLRKGLVKGKPNRFIAGHQTKQSGLPYTVSEKTGCWVWQRSVASNDYGCLGVGGKTILAHRYFYEKYKGPIPDGLQIDHLCCNKLCVNPDHLEAVTQLENTKRYRATIKN